MVTEKTLTISVAAYNAEEYLTRALDSCLIRGAERIEVIVVDDGSTDDTARIARHYVEVYPEVFRVISKENGGYGTTVNASLAIAQGRYFKLLDSDDWFDKKALQDLVDDLGRYDCDAAINPFVVVRDDGSRIVDQVDSAFDGLQVFTPDVVLNLLSMHSTTFKTELLRRIGLTLPAHRLYTDVLYALTPLFESEIVFVKHMPLYQYRLDRPDQSVSPESQVRHRGDKIAILGDLIALYDRDDRFGAAKKITKNCITANAAILLRIMFSLPEAEESLFEIRRLLDELRGQPEIWEYCKRHSRWFWLLCHCDGAMYSLACKFIRLWSSRPAI